MALWSSVSSVVRSIDHHRKPAAALTHSSARAGSVLIWLMHSVCSVIGTHARLPGGSVPTLLGIPPGKQAPAANSFTPAN